MSRRPRPGLKVLCRADAAKPKGTTVTALLLGITLAGLVFSCQPNSSPPPQTGTGPAELIGSVSLATIHMFSATTGWAEALEPPTTPGPMVRRLILRTTDGGQEWRNVTPRDLPAQPQGSAPTEYLDPYRAWMMGLVAPGQILVLRTIDGGTHWQETILRDSSVRYQLSDDGSAQLRFVDANHGWLFVPYSHAGNDAGALYKTVDGGAQWSLVSKTNPDHASSSAAPWQGFQTQFTFVDQKTGWLTAVYQPKPLLYVTHDAGTSWSPWPYPDASGIDLGGHAVSRPRFFSPTSGEFVALAGQSVVYSTTNAGATWQASVSPGCCEFSFVDANTGWAISWDNSAHSADLFQTSDAGQRWRLVYRHLDAQTELETSQHFITSLSALDFVSGEVGYVLRSSGLASAASAGSVSAASGSQTLMKTTDGGATWTEVHFSVS